LKEQLVIVFILIQNNPNKETQILEKRLVELEELLTQAKKKLRVETEYNKQLQAILEEEHPVRRSKIITIKSATKIEFVNVDDIICCHADEVYTHIQLKDDKKITVAKPLNTFETLLKGHDFFRISKSHIINPNYIITLYKDRNQILLQGNIILDIARRRRVEFLKTLNY